MCLIVVGWRVHPDFPLIVAANRDEFYSRPSAPAARWPEAPQILGGRDLEAGGTWLGISDSGRFAAVTNIREPGMAKGTRSRGALTRDFLLSDEPAADYVKTIDGTAYSGFNLLVADRENLFYCANRDGAPRALPPGIYGLSNHLLDSPWPKLLKARQSFATAISQLPNTNALFELLADREIIEDANLPDTGVPIEWERLLSAIFVVSESYGTRASTLAWQRANGEVSLIEQAFGPFGQPIQFSEISTAV
jgi:uncharacterized protein with NRDE domain